MSFARRNLFAAAAFLAICAAAALAGLWREFVGKREDALPTVTAAALPEMVPDADHAVLAERLEIPWSLGLLPDGRILVTERPGRVRLVDPQTGLAPEPVLTLKDVRHEGEGGLLGLAAHPDFAENRLVYLYYTCESETGPANKVVSYRLEKGGLTGERTIIDGIPAGRIHNGGRIAFGPDGLLYITTGDAGDPSSAQDRSSLAGKILRLRADGAIPADNPMPGSPVYSYGHRNPQGLAWDRAGRLWATEHGPQGHDEINRIEAGRNYGWPAIRGDERAEGMVSPVLHSGSGTWAPSGAAVLGDALYFAGLRGRALYRLDLNREGGAAIPLLHGAFGRLRDVAVGPDGLLYLLTSNRDGRGVPTGRDDLLVVLRPERLAPPSDAGRPERSSFRESLHSAHQRSPCVG